MKYSANNGALTVFPAGRIDSANAPSAEKEIMEIIGANVFDELTLDFSDLEYISSAGLRIVLKLIKRCPRVSAVNVSSEIYEILDMTGFTEMIEVVKAYRVIDVEGCEVVGEGANGKVYRIDRDTIVKVYRSAESIDDIKRERELARTAFVMGIPTAIPYDVVRVGDSYGSVFELLNAKSFCELMREDPSNLGFVAERSVEIAKIIHSTKAPENLPDEDDIVFRWIEQIRGHITAEEYDKFVALIKALPKDGTMIHGDLHIKNIMQQNDETLLIDMDTLCKGHPIYELGFIYNAYKGFGISDPGVIERFMGISSELAYELWRKTLGLYLGTDDPTRIDEVEEKASLIGLLRVMRRSFEKDEDNEASRALVAACRERVKAVLGRIDTLEFR